METPAAASMNLTTIDPQRCLPWTRWWPALLGPVAMALVYVLWWADAAVFMSRGVQEPIATHLTAIAVGCYAMAAWRGRDALHLLLLGLAVAFFCREIHFTGTGIGVYVAVALLGVCAVVWRQRLEATLAMGRVATWLLCTGWTYVLSQLIARRVFKRLALPYENELHVGLEEMVENTAHLMLIVTAFASGFAARRSGRGE